MSSINSSTESTFQRLREVRSALLPLHKALLDFERGTYERVNGPIRSNSEFFQLVIGHEWFDWLRPISQYIVQIDELFAAKEPATLDQGMELLAKAKILLTASETGSIAEERYYQAIQQDPDIAFMHIQITRLLPIT
jgi:hypothetical protein